ncbi:purine-nucleoside phosphorylase [bacterium]|nr:MAG: purine-nucleoside phosphorylase [bacterium]
MTGFFEDFEAEGAARELGREFSGVEACAVLGSGLSGAAEVLGVEFPRDYLGLAGKKASAPGHPGTAGIARVGGVKLLLFMGRPHYYEEGSMRTAAFPVRLAKALGARFCMLFSAVGGIGKDIAVGDWIFVDDHVNLMGQNPLLGVKTSGGPPFVDLSSLYRRDLFEPVRSSLPGISVKSGTLAGFSGPTYETPAEIRMAATLGCSTAGMSTVPESVWAKFLGLDTVAFGRVSNPAAGLGSGGLSHEDVLRETRAGGPEAAKLIEAALAAWAAVKNERG